jgi:phosphoglycerol transferase MdoB-like AlkP superfamily enzyme
LKRSTLSILVGLAQVILIIQVNHDLAVKYLSADGKSRALFFPQIFDLYNHRYYFLGLSGLSIFLIVLGIRNKENWRIVLSAILMSLLSIILIFVSPWKIMV